MLKIRIAIVYVAVLLADLLLCTGFEYLWYLSDLRFSPAKNAERWSILLINLITLGLLLVYRRRTRTEWIAGEARRWLELRKRGDTQVVAKRRRALLRGLFWTPCLIVLLIAPFVPELVGVASHLFGSRILQLDDCYQVQVPIAWITWDTSDDRIVIIAAAGLGRTGLKRYWQRDVPLSEMVFYPVPHPEQQLMKNVPLDGATILARRAFAMGSETLTCWDLTYENRFGTSYPSDPTAADISCATESEHFYAGFSGWRRDSSAFYETLQKVTLVR